MAYKWQREEISTAGAPRNTGPYSQGIRVGNLVFTSGEGPLDPVTGAVIEGSIEEQTRLVFQNLEAILQAAGTSLQNVVKVTAHLQDINDFDRFNKVYETVFTGPIRPVRTTVGSQLTVRVEVDVVAVIPEA